MLLEKNKKKRPVKLPLKKIKDDLLGKDYDLSLVFADKTLSRSLNSKYRKKNKPTDVLSFSLSDKMGEIFVCPDIAKVKAPKFGMTYENYLLYLVIHAILHLKGMEHGSKMTEYEFTYYDRYRYRYL